MEKCYAVSWPNDMSNTLQKNDYAKDHRESRERITKISANSAVSAVNFIQSGQGNPVILVHGLAASLHDWDELLPALAQSGYAGYALDLLGHGESAKPGNISEYTSENVFAHMCSWFESLVLEEPLVLIGHSLGGHLALQYILKYPGKVRALVLINPFYSTRQLPAALRLFFHQPLLNTSLIEHTPYWLFRTLIDLSSLTFGSSASTNYTLPESVRIQTAVDYKRASPNIFNIPRTLQDLTSSLPSINLPTLVIWGSNDQTLNPASFPQLVKSLPYATGTSLPAGHVPHQSHPDEVNKIVIDFLGQL